jgi:methylated-DNA-[protein]-cysteine S-methyltransferase
MTLTTRFTEINSPVGRLRLVADDEGLRRIDFLAGRGGRSPDPAWREDGASLRAVVEQLEAYFARELTAFSLALAPQGTPFQLTVWSRLRQIPYGRTISYGALAASIGRPTASRAVGLANGANPIPIVVPCHRVIGANGRLTGYGGGLDVKRRLLALEGVAPAPSA